MITNFIKRETFNANFVTIISSDVPMKNLKTVLKAIYLLKQDGLNVKLTIIGDLREENKNLINKLDLANNIDYKSKLPRDELIKSLNDADIGIAPLAMKDLDFLL